MKHLTDAELEQLVADVNEADRTRPPSGKLTPRLQRLLAENQELRTQAAEREFHFLEEGAS